MYLNDFIIQTATAIIILEVDEHSHGAHNLVEDSPELPADIDNCRWGYQVSCEQARMMNILAALRQDGETRSIVFIRYNPHAFNLDGKLHKESRESRETILVDLLQNWVPRADFEIQYMFYDTNHLADGSLRCAVWDHIDYDTKVAACCREPIV